MCIGIFAPGRKKISIGVLWDISHMLGNIINDTPTDPHFFRGWVDTRCGFSLRNARKKIPYGGFQTRYLHSDVFLSTFLRKMMNSSLGVRAKDKLLHSRNISKPITTKSRNHRLWRVSSSRLFSIFINGSCGSTLSLKQASTKVELFFPHPCRFLFPQVYFKSQ